ncbi:hypothetical protein AD949_06655 [Acetobacter orleanensis]|nr:hypothetical protein AD949_06655 [Acetobacter orleanensis]PCD79841.1 hypothetical protein CO710_05970 [Acetobacter orleanensis]
MPFPHPVILPENRRAVTSAWSPLPGSPAFLHRQAALDYATLTQIAAHLRKAARDMSPLIDTLYFRTAPLAVMECSTTLEALAQEIEQDDRRTMSEWAQNAICNF